jgi:hypothetical protein
MRRTAKEKAHRKIILKAIESHPFGGCKLVAGVREFSREFPEPAKKEYQREEVDIRGASVGGVARGGQPSPGPGGEHQGSTSKRPTVRSLPRLRGLLPSTGGGAALAVLGVGVVLTLRGLVAFAGSPGNARAPDS